VSALATDKYDHIWVGTDHSGVSRYDGTTWLVYNQANSGLSDDNTRAIAIDANDTKWIGTFDAGVAVFNLNGIPNTGIGEKPNPGTNILQLTVYPNPTSGNATFSYTLPENAQVQISIYDTRGQLIRQVLNAPRQLGQQTAEFDAAELQSGVYIYIVIAGNIRETGKIIVVR
jgi:ligand-binding sensor domain-containing protein